ncbi:unnamed protein product [Polarella glacialis]|uniref:Altered inheritance of mitochondria protein 24, mitochondrial n=1 Tax=Polarella glacialis TaxID=89957 RepID=A0A813FAC8_POLGL|nr:unnamed protein product [Polarella glacialis]
MARPSWTVMNQVVTMSDGVDIEGKMSGGLIGSLARAFFTQESFFTTTCSSRSDGQDVLIAADEPGDVVLHRLVPGEDLLLTSGAYLAGDSSVQVSSEVQSSSIGNSLLSGTGFFLLRARGSGMLACSSLGSVHKYELVPGERRRVDNGHLLAWTASMRYEVGLATRSLYNSFTSGEGLMCSFVGPGTLYLQSHKAPAAVGKGKEGGSGGRGKQAGPFEKCAGLCFMFVFLVIFVSIFATIAYQANFNPDSVQWDHRPAGGKVGRSTLSGGKRNNLDWDHDEF